MSKAVKKSQLYQSLWDSADDLRGGMDASQYKDYVLTILFVKYVSDKATGNPYEDITVPEGGSFADMVALKNKPNIGEGMDKIIAKLAEANGLQGVITNAHFNDEAKLGKGKEMVDTLTNLIGIFQRPELDFKNNSATDDDIIGDAYEYLMRKFATEGGKSKGQFYTPAEVARVLAKVIQIGDCTDQSASVYDPACGSGSLLIRTLAEAPLELAGYGQEKDKTTAGLAKMNAVLHGKTTLNIYADNTFAHPHNFDESADTGKQRFDYIVANPPFSMKNWMNGLETWMERFQGYGAMPPKKNGDYAWLMHILASLKGTGKAAVILPHGVLYRGDAEGTIRESIIRKGWIKGVIGLPPNLFYGTGIPACILIIDKENADARKSVFLVDASRGFVKDGSKNRLRECDVYRIVETFTKGVEDDPIYSRTVPIYRTGEDDDNSIEANGFNLSLARYLEPANHEDIQDIEGHLKGGIPNRDLDLLQDYWEAFPHLRDVFFRAFRDGYSELTGDKAGVRETLAAHGDCVEYWERVEKAYDAWMSSAKDSLSSIDATTVPAVISAELASGLLAEFAELDLLDQYDVYQAMLSYWVDTMADDVLLVSREGWSIGRQLDIDFKTKSVTVNGEKQTIATDTIKDYEGTVIPKIIVEEEYFSQESYGIALCAALQVKAEAELEALCSEAEENSPLFDLAQSGNVKDASVKAALEEVLEEADSPDLRELLAFQKWFEEGKRKKPEYLGYIQKHPSCKAALNDKGNVAKTSLAQACTEARVLAGPPEGSEEEYDELLKAQNLLGTIAEAKAQQKAARAALDEQIRTRYTLLTDDEIKHLLIERKWFYGVFDGIKATYDDEMTRFANRIIELAERYEETLPTLSQTTRELEDRVNAHLRRMGFEW